MKLWYNIVLSSFTERHTHITAQDTVHSCPANSIAWFNHHLSLHLEISCWTLSLYNLDFWPLENPCRNTLSLSSQSLLKQLSIFLSRCFHTALTNQLPSAMKVSYLMMWGVGDLEPRQAVVRRYKWLHYTTWLTVTCSKQQNWNTCDRIQFHTIHKAASIAANNSIAVRQSSVISSEFRWLQHQSTSVTGKHTIHIEQVQKSSVFLRPRRSQIQCKGNMSRVQFVIMAQ